MTGLRALPTTAGIGEQLLAGDSGSDQMLARGHDQRPLFAR